ncbi:type II toxin-antitoxin system RelE/ParE family toxin [Rhizobium sp. CF122]|uniref:type II toxin-antitoxin system RelE/ParE family toxin n=1 Tax=Rhizobium sp. CF122 TaxID=1144312 RepID=UPI0009DAE1C5|nr:type II toxin-antitoxin system RelE/ParE family toxin [Rhizobium sp. CF122]
MPRVVLTEGAVVGLDRCRTFLTAKNPNAARKAAEAIAHHFLLLETAPEMGRPFGDDPELRELIIEFGAAGYAALYRYVPVKNEVFVLAFRHVREAGY